MRASTSRRPTSSPRPAAWARSHRNQHGRPRNRHQLGGNLDFRIRTSLRTSSRARPNSRRACREGPRRDRRRATRARGWRALRARDRAARKPHRQPAARPLRTAGRPSLSRFYLSLDDDLLRIFGPQTLFARLMNRILRTARQSSLRGFRRRSRPRRRSRRATTTSASRSSNSTTL